MTTVAEETVRKRKETSKSKEKPPADYSIYKMEKEKWLEEHGWRNKNE